MTPKQVLDGLTVVFIALAMMFDAAMIIVCLGLETGGIYTIDAPFAFLAFILCVNAIGMGLLCLPRRWFE